MTTYFYNTGEMYGLTYVKSPSAILNIEHDVKYCSMWSILNTLHSSVNSRPNIVSNIGQYFKYLKFMDVTSDMVINLVMSLDLRS